jgi:hypothetical protein
MWLVRFGTLQRSALLPMRARLRHFPSKVRSQKTPGNFFAGGFFIATTLALIVSHLAHVFCCLSGLAQLPFVLGGTDWGMAAPQLKAKMLYSFKH